MAVTEKRARQGWDGALSGSASEITDCYRLQEGDLADLRLFFVAEL
jgi:hypothetical protein